MMKRSKSFFLNSPAHALFPIIKRDPKREIKVCACAQ